MSTVAEAILRLVLLLGAGSLGWFAGGLAGIFVGLGLDSLTGQNTNAWVAATLGAILGASALPVCLAGRLAAKDGRS